MAQAKGFGGVLALVLLCFAIRGGADQPMMAGRTSGSAANDRVPMQPFASAVGGADTRASDKAAHAVIASELRCHFQIRFGRIVQCPVDEEAKLRHFRFRCAGTTLALLSVLHA